ncbi:MAG: hypothetical protein V2A34_16310 [Lentisphaerota bacterium]
MQRAQFMPQGAIMADWIGLGRSFFKTFMSVDYLLQPGKLPPKKADRAGTDLLAGSISCRLRRHRSQPNEPIVSSIILEGIQAWKSWGRPCKDTT